MIKKKILIATGGTGGHVFPAYSLAKHLINNNYILINFWSSWCAPCRKEHTLLMKLSKEKNLKLFGVNMW